MTNLRDFKDGEMRSYLDKDGVIGAHSPKFGPGAQIGDVGYGYNVVILDGCDVWVFDIFGGQAHPTDFKTFDCWADAFALATRIVDAPLTDESHPDGEGYPDAWAAICDEMESL